MKYVTVIVVCVYGLLAFSNTALANKSSASIEAPVMVEKGTDVTIKVTVTHKGNSFIHYTRWLKIDIDGKTLARFDYTSGSRPEAETFTKEFKVNALRTMEIVAESSCNIHGSAGPTKTTVVVNN
jgi:desulfoferrodoxin (superoxide reductase-like protein)